MFNEKTEEMRSTLSCVELQLNSQFGWRTTAQASNIPLLETPQLVSIKLVSEQRQTGLNWASKASYYVSGWMCVCCLLVGVRYSLVSVTESEDLNTEAAFMCLTSSINHPYI